MLVLCLLTRCTSAVRPDAEPAPVYFSTEEEFDWKTDQLTARVGELSDSDIFYWLAVKMLPLYGVDSLYLMCKAASQW